jgi:hypothetical protein
MLKKLGNANPTEESKAKEKALTMKTNWLISSLLISIALSACGPTLRAPTVSPYLLQQEAELQREYTYKTVIERRIKLQRIYTPLRIANADICGPNVSPVTGIFGIDLHSLDIEMRPIAQRLHGVGDGIKILDVVPTRPPQKAVSVPATLSPERQKAKA